MGRIEVVGGDACLSATSGVGHSRYTVVVTYEVSEFVYICVNGLLSIYSTLLIGPSAPWLG